jgi:hypothetical protein
MLQTKADGKLKRKACNCQLGVSLTIETGSARLKGNIRHAHLAD